MSVSASLFFIAFVKPIRSLYWSNVYQQDHRSGCLLIHFIPLLGFPPFKDSQSLEVLHSPFPVPCFSISCSLFPVLELDLEPAIWSRNTGSRWDTLLWQLSINHNMDVEDQWCTHGNGATLLLIGTSSTDVRTDGHSHDRKPASVRAVCTVSSCCVVMSAFLLFSSTKI